MSTARTRLGAALAAFALLLQACATTPPPVGGAESERQYLARVDRLSATPHWIVEGRLAVRDGEDGGSGTLRWQSGPDRSRLDFHGALGRGAWRLVAAPGDAVLTEADGAVFRADSVDGLVTERLGWRVPVEELSWWIRGLAAPGSRAHKVLGEGGALLSLKQSGWEIAFSRYREFGDEQMPGLVVARRDERQVRFAIRDWTLGEGAGVES